MALAPFYNRIYGSVSGYLPVSRETLAGLLKNNPVGVDCSDSTHPNGRVIAELTVNILSRLYSSICITGKEDFADEMRRLARRINPDISFAKSAAGIHTIATSAGTEGRSLFPSSSGWVARLDHGGFREHGTPNPIGAAAAAALACAELFRRVFTDGKVERDYEVSLLDYSRRAGADFPEPRTDLGQVLIAGVGAVGNGALWTLGKLPSLTGELVLVDRESLSLSNLQRYVLGAFSDVDSQKTSLGERALARGRFIIRRADMSLEEFADINAQLPPTTAISVDNVESRRAAQALLPRRVVNGWTGDGSLGASWHDLSGHAACLACMYHPKGIGPSATDQAAKALGLPIERSNLLWATHQGLTSDDLTLASKALGVTVADLEPWLDRQIGDLYTDVVCGAAPVDVRKTGTLEVVPLCHQSVLAGILMAAELIKRTSTDLEQLSQPETLVSWDNVLRPPPSAWCKPRAREPGCICSDPDYIEVFRAKWRM